MKEPDKTGPDPSLGDSPSDLTTPPNSAAETAPTQSYQGEELEIPFVDGYELIRILGRGGMGVVYEARDLNLNRRVAIKMIRTLDHSKVNVLARFRTEARAAARLQQPNIVQVFEVGDQDGHPYIALELVNGRSLGRVTGGAPQSPDKAAEMTEILARAVQYAHDRSIVHRDLKPGNILVESTAQSGFSSDSTSENVSSSDSRSTISAQSASGSVSGGRMTSDGLVPKITDFGLAKQLDVDDSQTMTGEIMGTPKYMSPEQAQGRHAVIGPSTDIYSLGAILFELLTGRPPFQGANPVETLRMVSHDEPVPPTRLQPRLPRDIETICLKCLDKDPARRYATAGSLADDLRRFLNSEPIIARPVSRTERCVKWARRKPAIAGLLASVVLVALVGIVAVTWQWRRTVAAQRRTAYTQIELLLHAEPDVVPTIVENLTPYRTWIDPSLRQMLKNDQLTEHQRSRIQLALLSVDPDYAAQLGDRLLESDVSETPTAELLVIRDALIPYSQELKDRFWSVLHDAEAEPDRRFRAAIVLAEFDPDGPAERWQSAAHFLVHELVDALGRDPGAWSTLVRAMAPVHDTLRDPLIELVTDGSSPELERNTATSVLAEYESEDVPLLANLILSIDSRQHLILLDKLTPHGLHSIDLLRDVLDEVPPAESDAEERNRHVQRQAVAAITLAQLGKPELLWRLLRFHEDPSLQTCAIHEVASRGFNPLVLTEQLTTESDASIRQALLLSLGEYRHVSFDRHLQSRLIEAIREILRTDADSGVHSAARWLLLRMGNPDEIRDLENQLISDGPVNGRNWYQNSLGIILALVHNPQEFRMGSKRAEPGRQSGESYHRRHIPRDFAISTTEVTLDQFQRMIEASPSLSYEHDEKYASGPESPAIGVSWYDAVRFCRWLSEQEGIPEDQMCYPPIDQLQDDDGVSLQLPDDYLTRTGYRLPTEAEWEFACRAGTITPRYFGHDRRLCGHYAWSLENALDRVHPVGSLKPNRLGLFDMYGNVWEWCQNRRGPYPVSSPTTLVSDIAANVDPSNEGPHRVLRGGSLQNRTEVLRSAQRDWFDVRSQRNHNVGFRVARTIRTLD